ncbi:hypothetical protein B0H63DRAFT_156212 [Podospora didyma]|uniref:Uncharacterized protein n=1 Tax=Podospora didyma TaxID=330526 RepID=A0AAE0NTE9_9PEZI|nr:hypothetical protein B0H63DRAFT_156212 [Podospora didyma]
MTSTHSDEKKPRSSGSSGSSDTILTPSTSSRSHETPPPAHLSAASDPPSGPSTSTSPPMLEAYIGQSPMQHGSIYGRIQNQAQRPDPYSRIPFYAVRAVALIDDFESNFDTEEQQ